MSGTTTRYPYRACYHRDATVTGGDVYRQGWVRTARPSDEGLASLGYAERARVMRHCGIAA